MRQASAACESLHTTDSEESHALLLSDLDEQSRLLGIMLFTIFHFGGDIKQLFSGITDPRNPKKITYSVGELCFAALLMFIYRLKARRGIALLLRGGFCGEKFREIFQTPECPHGDTINDAFASMNPDEFQDVICRLVNGLIRNKVLYAYRLLGRYFVIAIDATRVLTRKECHCPRCLHQTRNGKTTYYHMVLEAKIVTSTGFVIPLFTEFVENKGQDAGQDCELKAFYRMADKIKARFGRLPIFITGDGLYAAGPVFGRCEDHGWKYMVVFKDNDLPNLNEEFEALSALQVKNRLTRRVSDGKTQVEQSFRWVNRMVHTDTKNRDHTVDVIECIETRTSGGGKQTVKKFRWITNMEVTSSNVISLADEGGRVRWTIENQGFNVQKNGGYGLTHMYSQNENSAKIFHLLLQIAHLFMQLIVRGSLMNRFFPGGMGSERNVAFRLLEAWRNARMPGGIMRRLTQWRLQIRFCPDTS